MIEEIMELFKKKTAKECYKIVIDEKEPGIMDDKIGGIPYIPVGEEYPLDNDNNPMSLLIQVNLANIDLEDYPHEGILEIFIDKECFWPCNYQVRYYKKIGEYRTDLDNIAVLGNFIEKPLKINLVKDIEHMPMTDYRFGKTMAKVIEEVTGKVINNYSEVEDYFETNGCDFYKKVYEVNIFSGNISGYADFTQTDPRPFKEAPDTNECLVKIDSNLGHGIMIGDCGIIFAFISKEDLKAGNFENVIVDWDCC